MKKRITYKDWEDAGMKVQMGWQSWCHKSGNTVVAISGKDLLCPPDISTMIDFLGKPDIEKWEGYIDGTVESQKELCDLFWEIVKEKLEK